MNRAKGPAATLRNMLNSPEFLIMPCCYDALSAKLIQKAGFPLTLLSASIKAMIKALSALGKGESFNELVDFQELQSLLGFPEYDKTLRRFEG